MPAPAASRHGHALARAPDSGGGVPLGLDGAASITRTVVAGEPPRLLHAVADADGGFVFDIVAPGAYRVIAHSWPELEASRASLTRRGG